MTVFLSFLVGFGVHNLLFSMNTFNIPTSFWRFNSRPVFLLPYKFWAVSLSCCHHHTFVLDTLCYIHCQCMCFGTVVHHIKKSICMLLIATLLLITQSYTIMCCKAGFFRGLISLCSLTSTALEINLNCVNSPVMGYPAPDFQNKVFTRSFTSASSESGCMFHISCSVSWCILFF
jgi:hypothetical protein